MRRAPSPAGPSGSGTVLRIAVDLAKAVAIFVIPAMLAIVACLGMFLREVFLAVASGTHRIR